MEILYIFKNKYISIPNYDCHMMNIVHQNYDIVGPVWKTLGFTMYIISNCLLRLVMDLIGCVIHGLNILSNMCSCLLPTLRYCQPSPLRGFIRITTNLCP